MSPGSVPRKEPDIGKVLGLSVPWDIGGGGNYKGDSGEKPESVSRVSEKTLTNLISEFQKKKFS